MTFNALPPADTVQRPSA